MINIPNPSTLPTPEAIAEIEHFLEKATIEIEPFRHASCEILGTSGASFAIFSGCQDWALNKLQQGADPEITSRKACNGMIASAFQLGILAGIQIAEAQRKKYEEETRQ